MRIGYFGGSFDPPHTGHLVIARAAAQAFSLDKVLFAPTGNQPLKPQGASASYADRLAMISLLCEAPPSTRHFEASTLDSPLPNHAPNFTVDTLKRLRATLTPADSIFGIVGLDAFLDLPRWRNPRILLSLCDWIVTTRPGLDPCRLASLRLSPTERSRVHLLAGLAEPASATQIRSDLARGADCSTLLPAQVLDYIHAHHLYTIT